MTLEYIFIFLLGLSMGSFLTVVAERFDSVERFWQGRSHCNHCKKVLTWWELIPLVGYLLLHGKCQHCRRIIPRFYPFIELLCGLTFLGLFLAQTELNYLVFVGQLIVVSLLFLLLIYDWINQSFPALLLSLSFSITLAVTSAIIVWAPDQRPIITSADPILTYLSTPTNLWWSMLKGGMLGVVALGLFAVPSRGKWMGYGDVLLVGILGIWLGYPFIVLALILAFYLGAIVAIGQIVTRTVARDHHIAFGPFLIAGAIIVQIWGGDIFASIIKFWG
jgi:prepilin signal peptidase PulO-like enzyme (type II secretory pathway)